MSDDRIRQEAKAARASLEETAVVKLTDEIAREPEKPVAVPEAAAKPLTIKAAPGGVNSRRAGQFRVRPLPSSAAEPAPLVR